MYPKWPALKDLSNCAGDGVGERWYIERHAQWSAFFAFYSPGKYSPTARVNFAIAPNHWCTAPNHGADSRANYWILLPASEINTIVKLLWCAC